MTDQEKHLRQSASLMRILGWILVVGLIVMMFIYPPGFMWGAHPEGFPNIGPAHPPSPYDGLHPYMYMLGVLYIAYGILLIRGAKDPRRNVALFDFGILSSVLHGLLMVLQSFYYPNEHAHLWADVPSHGTGTSPPKAGGIFSWPGRGFQEGYRMRPSRSSSCSTLPNRAHSPCCAAALPANIDVNAICSPTGKPVLY